MEVPAMTGRNRATMLTIVLALCAFTGCAKYVTPGAAAGLSGLADADVRERAQTGSVVPGALGHGSSSSSGLPFIDQSGIRRRPVHGYHDTRRRAGDPLRAHRASTHGG